MIVPIEFTHLGWDFNVEVGNSKRHSGVDLNFGRPEEDRGMPVKATEDGVVIFAENTGKGWGNLVVIFHPHLGVWSRYGHLQEITTPRGTAVQEGHIIGRVGSTGGDWSPHLHFDIIIKELPTWTAYTTNFTAKDVEEYYTHPLQFIERHNRKLSIDEPIVKWNKDNGFLTNWSATPTMDELRDGWLAYKILKAVKDGSVNNLEFNL